MTSFHFNYESQYYTAQGNVNRLNGKISFELLGILNDETNQPVSWKEFNPYDANKNKKDLMDTLEKALAEYLNNYPVAHCETTNTL